MEQLRVELIEALAEAGRLAGMENLVSEPYKTRYEAREVLVSLLHACPECQVHQCAVVNAGGLLAERLVHRLTISSADVGRSLRSAPS